MFTSITSFTLCFFLPMCTLIILGILFEETLIRFEQRLFSRLRKRAAKTLGKIVCRFAKGGVKA